MPGTFIPVENCIGARINVHYGTYPNVMNNLLHFHCPTAVPGVGDCVTVALLLSDWIDAEYAPYVSNSWTFDSVEAFGDDSPAGAFSSFPMTTTGGQATTLQPDAAPLLLLKTGRRGRSNSGRFYAFAPDDPAIGATQYVGSHMAHLREAMEALITAATAAGYPLVVKSSTLAETHEVFTVTHSARLTKQSRRRLGFGG